MTATAAFILVLLSSLFATAGPPEVSVRPGKIAIPASGRIETADVFQLKATFEGRAEKVWTATGVWVTPRRELASLVNKEFAALLDSHGSTRKETLQDRWKPVYLPRLVRCPRECCILKSFVRSGQWVKPQAVLFEAAARLRLVGRVPSRLGHLVRNGMVLEYWAVRDPSRRFRLPVSGYSFDSEAQDGREGTFSVSVGSEQPLRPGTAWKGVITRKTNVLVVPDNALRRVDGELMLRVSTAAAAGEGAAITTIAGPQRDMVIESGSLANSEKEAGAETEEPESAARGTGPEINDPDSNLSNDPYSE
jgi:hypothetical protein